MPAHRGFAFQRHVQFHVAIGVGIACALAVGDPARGTLLLKDSFGLSPVTTQDGTRFDAAGNFVGVFLRRSFSRSLVYAVLFRALIKSSSCLIQARGSLASPAVIRATVAVADHTWGN